jgi:ketosteroid isomerase-like protein
MVRARALPLLLAALAAGCATGPGRDAQGHRHLPRSANPSAVIAAEYAFARAAQEKGQWTAFAQTAAPDAVMFVPAPVLARDWLKGRPNPPAPVSWQPHRVWTSCDGSLAVSHGAWQSPDGTQGQFVTVWHRQTDGSWQWVMDTGGVLQQPLARPEMVAASVADCAVRPTPVAMTGPEPNPGPAIERRSGATPDKADGTRTVTISQWRAGERRIVLDLALRDATP